MASSVPPSSATPSAQGGRSPALPVAIALGAVVAGVMFYNKSKTGQADNIGKAMAKTATPANSSGGLGKMDADVGLPELHERTLRKVRRLTSVPLSF